MEVVVTAHPDGTCTVHVASLLYDLWEDYSLYRQEAESVDREAEPLRYKRLVRASVQAFFGYFEGVLNEWVSRVAPEKDLEKTSFWSKIKIISKTIPNDQRVPPLNLDRAREIRNTIVHVKPTTSDIQTMETLLDGKFFHDADQFVIWLDHASHTLKLERHPDVPGVLKDMIDSLGVPKQSGES
jgi:hypothetical protein